MKIVFNLLVIALAAAAGWYFQPEVVKWLETRKLASRKALDEQVQAAIAAKGGSDSPATTSKIDTPSAAQQLAEAMRKKVPAVSSTAPKTPAPETAATGEPMNSPPSAPAETVDVIEARYPLPVFKSIDDITKEWSTIPSRAFPRPVKTLVPVTFEGPKGKIKLPEKSEALAVGMVQGMLVLMRNRDDPARSMVPLANTDLKETLTALYEKFKTFKTDEVMKHRERAREMKNHANGASEAELAKAGPKPRVSEDGVVPAMVDSLKAKDIKETTADRIISWGELRVEQVKGDSYWTGTIQCTVDNAIFGPIPTELMALIRDDKVVKWLYSGSKEEVQ